MPPKRTSEQTGSTSKARRLASSNDKQRDLSPSPSSQEDSAAFAESSATPAATSTAGPSRARRAHRTLEQNRAEHATVRQTVDRVLPSLTHQTTTLLNWALLEQLRFQSQILSEMATLQRHQTLLAVDRMRGNSPSTASWFMDVLRDIPRARAPTSLLGPEADAAWSQLSSPGQYLMQAARDLSFAHHDFPALTFRTATSATDAIEEAIAEAASDAVDQPLVPSD